MGQIDSKTPIPNLFIIGAAKCATTTVHSVLSKHEEVFMSEPKEPNFFARSDYNKKWHWYLSHFEEVPKNTKIIGESSPFNSNTFLTPDIAHRIHDFNPTSKIIYIVRHPFQRLTSVFTQGLSTGHWLEDKIGQRLNISHKIMPLDFEDAILKYDSFLEETRYFSNISEFIKTHGRENVLILFQEDLKTNAKLFYINICEFLNISPFQNGKDFDVELNLGKTKRMSRPSFERLPFIVKNNLRRILPPAIFKYVRTKTIPSIKIEPQTKEYILSELNEEITQILELGGKPKDFWKFD